MTSLPQTGQSGSEHVKSRRQTVISEKRTNPSSTEHASSTSLPIRPVRIKRPKEQDLHNSGTSKESDRQPEKPPSQRQSRIAVLTSNGRKGNDVRIKTVHSADDPRNVQPHTSKSPQVRKRITEGYGSAKIDISPKVQKRSSEGHVYVTVDKSPKVQKRSSEGHVNVDKSVNVQKRSSEGHINVSIDKSPTVRKRSQERRIHFSDEQDKQSTTPRSCGDRKKHLKDKREYFKRSKSSTNSEHVSEDLSPFSDSKPKVQQVSPAQTRRRNTSEEIPLKEFAKTSDYSSTRTVDYSSSRNVAQQHTNNWTDQTGSNKSLHDKASLKERVTHNPHTQTIDHKQDTHAHKDHEKRSSRAQPESKFIKPEPVQHERDPYNKQQLTKQFLSPEIISPVIEQSKSQQRLQNQSSTETSGLGETITSGFTSQESLTSVHSNQTGGKPAIGTRSRLSLQEDLGIDLREDTTTGYGEDNDTLETETIDPSKVINGKNEQGNYSENIKSRFINKTGPIHTPSGREGAQRAEGREISDKLICYPPMKDQVDPHQIHFLGPTDQLNNNGASKKRGSQPNTDVEQGNLDQEGGINAPPDFDELFQQSESLPQQPTSMGLGIEQINNEWNRHTRASSIKSIRSNRSSQGSFRSRSGSTRRSKRFLGEPESKWMKWGRERRSSFRRRLDKLEHPEPEVPKRPSTPIKKARQEGRMFIHPDLESKYISEEDINYIQRHQQQRLQTYNVIEKSKSSTYQYDRAGFSRLTANDLNILARFWEHRVFVRSRYISILLSFVTVVIYIVGISSSNWIIYPSEDVIGAEGHEGLFYACRPIYEGGAMTEVCDGSAQRGHIEC